jgi:hypothetical protein
METLPDELILLTASYLTVDNFLSLRSITTHFYALLQFDISGTARAVARNTFPGKVYRTAWQKNG